MNNNQSQYACKQALIDLKKIKKHLNVLNSTIKKINDNYIDIENQISDLIKIFEID